MWNDSKDDDIVHWHGFHIPPEVDGAYEEGTPGVPPNGGRQRYVFTPDPAGSRWYHSHTVAGRNLRKSTYSGQFGMFIVEADDDAGAYDQEVPILLHEWDRTLRRREARVEFKLFSINGKMLGAGDPIRVQAVAAGAVPHRECERDAASPPGAAGPPVQRHRARRKRGAAPARVPILDLGPGNGSTRWSR